MRKAFSIILITALLACHFSVAAYATDDELEFRAFQEYNRNKIQLMLAGMRYYGGVVSSGSSGRKDIRNGRAEKEPAAVSFPLSKKHGKWYAFSGDQKFTEEELYLKFGLTAEAEQARKTKSLGRGLFIGGNAGVMVGAGAMGLQFLLSGEVSLLGYSLTSLAVVGCSISATVGNIKCYKRVLDYPAIYRLVKKDNLQLLKTYFPDADLAAEELVIDGLRTISDIEQYELKQLGLDHSGTRTWKESKLQIGATPEEVLGVFGVPDSADNFGNFSAWDYLRNKRSYRSFNIGTYTDDTYDYERYSLYFKNGMLADWSRQVYTTYD